MVGRGLIQNTVLNWSKPIDYNSSLQLLIQKERISNRCGIAKCPSHYILRKELKCRPTGVKTNPSLIFSRNLSILSSVVCLQCSLEHLFGYNHCNVHKKSSLTPMHWIGALQEHSNECYRQTSCEKTLKFLE